jgi:hypothetical protein
MSKEMLTDAMVACVDIYSVNIQRFHDDELVELLILLQAILLHPDMTIPHFFHSLSAIFAYMNDYEGLMG